MSKYQKQISKSYQKEILRAKRYFEREEYDKAKKIYLNIYKYYRNVNNLSKANSILVDLAKTYEWLKQFEDAIESLKNALEYYNQVKDLENVSEILFKIGSDYYFLTDLKKSEKFLLKSLRISQTIDNKKRQVGVLFTLGILYRFMGKLEDAITNVKKAIDVNSYFKRSSFKGIMYLELARLYDQINDDDNLQKYYYLAKEDYENSKNYKNLATFYNDISSFHGKIEGLDRIEVLEKGLEIAKTHNLKSNEALIRSNLGFVLEGEVDSIIVDNHFKRALKIAKDVKNKDVAAATNMLYGQVMLERDEYEEAINYINNAIQIAKNRKEIYMLIRCYSALGRISYQKEQYKDSYINYSESLEWFRYIFDNLHSKELKENFKESFKDLPEIIKSIHETIEEGNLKPELDEIEKLKEIAIKFCKDSSDFEDFPREKLIEEIKKLVYKTQEFEGFKNQVIDDLLKKIRKYQNRELEKTNFLLFLDQLQDIDLKKSMLKLLNRVKNYYISLDEMAERLGQEIKALPFNPATRLYFAVLNNLWNKSASFWSYLLKKNINISGRRLTISKATEIIPKLKNYSKSQEIFIIFIDDVIGTGKQFIESFKQYFETQFKELSYHHHENINLYLIAGVGSSESFKLIPQYTLLDKNCIRFSLKLTVEDKAFNKKYWKDEQELNKLLEFLQSLDPLHWDGWKRSSSEKGLEYLVVLEWNTPNNTISCLWKETDKWKALFPRS